MTPYLRRSWCCLLVAAVVACNNPPRQPTLDERLERALTDARGDSRWRREQGGAALVGMCCEHAVTRACDEVSRLLRDDSAVSPGNVVGAADPRCLNQISSILLTACTERCSADASGGIVSALASIDPSSEVTAALLRQLEQAFDPAQRGAVAETSERDAVMRTPQEQVRDFVALSIANLGEDDLGPIVSAIAAHPRKDVRRVLLEGIGHAIDEAPLRLPELLVALDAAATDPDPVVAALGEELAHRYRRQFTRPFRRAPESYVDAIARDSDAMRVLSVRRFSCYASNAEGVLRELAAAEPERRRQFEHAIELRRRRCARIQERDWE